MELLLTPPSQATSLLGTQFLMGPCNLGPSKGQRAGVQGRSGGCREKSLPTQAEPPDIPGLETAFPNPTPWTRTGSKELQSPNARGWRTKTCSLRLPPGPGPGLMVISRASLPRPGEAAARDHHRRGNKVQLPGWSGNLSRSEAVWERLGRKMK